MSALDSVRHLGPCFKATAYLADQPDPAAAWDNCDRGDWMLWLAARIPTVSRQILVLAACDCARTALRFVLDGELRPLRAIEAAEAWAADPTEKNLSLARVTQSAAAASSAAAYAASSDAASSAAAYAAYAAYAASSDAATAAAASSAAAYAAYAAKKQHADLVRQRIPAEMIVAALGA